MDSLQAANTAAEEASPTTQRPKRWVGQLTDPFQKQAMGGRRGHLEGGHKQYHCGYRHKDAPACVAPLPRHQATTSLELRCLSPDPDRPRLTLDITSQPGQVEQIEFKAKVLIRPLRGSCIGFWSREVRLGSGPLQVARSPRRARA